MMYRHYDRPTGDYSRERSGPETTDKISMYMYRKILYTLYNDFSERVQWEYIYMDT